MIHSKRIEELNEYLELRLKTPILESMEISYSSHDLLESEAELDEFIDKKSKPTFQELLLSYIDQVEETDTEIYKKAGIDRRHFSKIRSNIHYQPSKPTVLSLALALELPIHKANQLLQAAGYAFSDSHKFDLVIQFCIEKRIYNRIEVNELLDYYGLKILG